MPQSGADQHQSRIAVREGDDHAGVTSDLTIQALNHVVGADLRPVFGGEIAVGQRFLNNVLDFSLTAFIRYAKEKNTSCTMRYYEADPQRLVKSGVSEIGEDDLLIALEEKPADPKSHWCTPPFYFYKAQDARRIREAIADGCGTDAPGSLVSWMCRHATLHSMEMPGSRYDIGNLESYRKVQETYRGIVK